MSVRLACLLLCLALCGCPEGPQAPLPMSKADSPRTVTPSPALAEWILAIGAETHLVGVSPFCTYPPGLAALPRIGGLTPNLEQLEVLKPDLLLWQGSSEVAEGYAMRRGSQFETFSIESFAEVESTLGRLGELFTRQEQAAAAVVRLRAAIEAAKSQAPAKRPRVLLVFGREPGQLRTVPAVGGGTFLSECLAACGGDNVLADRSGWPNLGPEGLLELAPDVIVELINAASVPEAELAARVDDWSRYAQIPAVATGRVHTVVGDELLIPGPRLEQVLEKLGRTVRE